MESALARRLIELNTQFYRHNAGSFCATRRSAWPGWDRCLQLAGVAHHGGGEPCRVLDVACGNLRFEGYLREACPRRAFELYAVDNCAALQKGQPDGALQAGDLCFQQLDVLGCLADAWDAATGDARPAAAAAALANAIQAPPCHLTALFGFMHHVPRAQWRAAVLRALVQKTAPGGFACVSFWQFMQVEAMARKARHTTDEGASQLGLDASCLDQGDYLLGWNGAPGTYRYCHHFAEAEVDELAAQVADVATPVARFDADGRTGALNSYLVLQRRC